MNGVQLPSDHRCSPREAIRIDPTSHAQKIQDQEGIIVTFAAVRT